MTPDPPPARRWQAALARRLVVLAALLLAANLLSLAAGWHWLAELSVHFVPHYLVAAALLGVALALLRRWRWSMACATVLALSLWRAWPYLAPLEPPAQVPVRAEAQPEVMARTGFQVLQWNVGTRHPEPERALTWILERELTVDVVVLLEVSSGWQKVLEVLRRFYPHSRVELREDNFGIAVFSRLPGSDIRLLTHRSSGLPSMLTIAEAPGGEAFALWAVHPPPPVNAELAALRNRQLQTLVSTARDPALPMLVAGDLNTTPWSPWFARLLEEGRLRDSARGRGLTPTWAPAMLPGFLGLPIDHLLFTRHFRVLERYAGPRSGSDHRPVVTRLELPPAGS